MTFQIELSEVKKEILDLNNQSVRVGILEDKKASGINWKRGMRKNKNGIKMWCKKNTSTGETLNDLLSKMEKQRGVLSKALSLAENKELIKVTNLFAKMEKTELDIKSLQNACKAIVKNPILRGDYGKNSKKWIEKKGFDKYGIATGKTFDNIGAIYRDKK